MARCHVIIPTDLKPAPARYEITAATLLADYFKADAEFILRSNQKMHMAKIRNEVERHFGYTKPIKRLILIDKNKAIVELSR